MDHETELVLLAVIDRGAFGATPSSITQKTGIGIDRVKAALAELQSTGSVKPIYGGAWWVKVKGDGGDR